MGVDLGGLSSLSDGIGSQDLVHIGRVKEGVSSGGGEGGHGQAGQAGTRYNGYHGTGPGPKPGFGNPGFPMGKSTIETQGLEEKSDRRTRFCSTQRAWPLSAVSHGHGCCSSAAFIGSNLKYIYINHH
jgi:hypothetical protein